MGAVEAADMEGGERRRRRRRRRVRETSPRSVLKGARGTLFRLLVSDLATWNNRRSSVRLHRQAPKYRPRQQKKNSHRQ